MSAIRDRVAAAVDIEKESLTVPEWDNVTVEVRGLTLGGRNAIFGKPGEEVELATAIPALIINTVYDPESGEKVFTDADKDLFADKSASVVDRVAKLAMKLSGMDEDPETTAKNSETTLTAVT